MVSSSAKQCFECGLESPWPTTMHHTLITLAIIVVALAMFAGVVTTVVWS